MTRRAPWPVLVAVAVLASSLALIVGRRTTAPYASFAPVHAAVRAPPTSYATSTFDGARAELLARTANAEWLAESSPESFNRHAEAAGYRLDYGQLTGDYEGYFAAERHLAEAFAAVERRGVPVSTGTGPFLLKAQIDYTLHRFERTLADLDAPERDAKATHDPVLLAEVKALRGSATFARGDYEGGLALLRDAERLDSNPSHSLRLALALAKVGEEAEAIGRLERAPATTARGRAWNELQRALIDLKHGRREAAREKLVSASASFPGFWLVEEHVAELDADEGRTETARAAYARLVERTGDPEFMDALARLIECDSPDEAKKLVARSTAIYANRLARLPEASYGHALEHTLRMDPDPSHGVSIAEKNRDVRPDGEARTRLTQAYFRAGRLGDARREIAAVLATRWVSGETYATAAIVFAASREPAAAATMSARAKAQDPFAEESLAWLHVQAR